MLTEYGMCKHMIDQATMIWTILTQGLRDFSYENQHFEDVERSSPVLKNVEAVTKMLKIMVFQHFVHFGIFVYNFNNLT